MTAAGETQGMGAAVTTDGQEMSVEELETRLAALREEHQDLDAAIGRVSDNPPFDQFQLNRLKKRKLVLKDEISWLEDQIYPDIIA